MTGQEQNSPLIDPMAMCVADIKTACGTIFPDIFYAEFSILHQQIFDLINMVMHPEYKGSRKIAIAAPRGIGKTSIARAVAMVAILFRLQNFIVYLSNSATSAEMQTENIKRDLLTNVNVRRMFGSIKDAIGNAKGIDETFSKSAWTAYGDCFILPRGAGQQVRGLNWSNHRPGLVIIDDLEDKDEIRSEDNRKKLKSWFHADLMKTEDRYGDGCVFIYIDTIKHEDSLLVDLLASDDWSGVQLSICDDKYNSLDPNYMTTEEIKAEVAEHRKMGTLDEFYMERMNMPVSLEDRVFKPEYFKQFKDTGDKIIITDKDGAVEEIPTYRLLHVTITDPAKTVKVQSAETAIITVAVDRETRRIFVRDIVSRKLYPDEIYAEMFRQVVLYRSYILGYEVTGLNEFIIQPVKNECRTRNLHPQLIELKAKDKKENRVATLAPLYRLGYMYHNEACSLGLEGQLLGFPRSKLWDIMDALAYITFIMDKMAILFDPADETEEEPDEEDYDELKSDGMMSEQEMGFSL